jgi:hypothetical protein
MIKNCSKTMKNVACDGFIQVGWVNFESKKHLACKTLYSAIREAINFSLQS